MGRLWLKPLHRGGTAGGGRREALTTLSVTCRFVFAWLPLASPPLASRRSPLASRYPLPATRYPLPATA